MVDMDVRVLSHLKEELAWATDKQLQVISTLMLFRALRSYKEKNEAILNLKQYCMCCYVVLSNVF